MTKKKVLPINVEELRRLAEAALGDSTEQEPHAMVEVQHLLHELNVHHIELKMQNDELIQSRDDLETLLDKYTELYEFAPVGYFTIAQTGLISNINLAGSALIGHSRDRLNGRRFTDFISRADRAAFSAFLGRLFRSHTKENLEIALLKRGKGRVFVKIVAVAAASGLECRLAMMDVSERKRAEEALQKVEMAAGIASQKLETVAGVARRKVEVVAGVARRKVAQAMELALCGVQETTEVASQRLADAAILAFQKMEEAAELAHLKVDDAAGLANLKVAEAAALVLPAKQEATEAVRKAADAAREMVERAADLARQKVKETAELMFHALRQAAEAEAQIKYAEERLKHEELLFHTQNLESLGVLAGGIAHDFNNILTSILGNIALAQLSIEETHQASKPLFFAEKAGRRAAELAARLLTFAKGGAPVKRTVALSQVIEESVALTRGWAGLTCVVHLSEELGTIEADEGQVNQVFQNLIINAAQAMPDGGKLTIVAENVRLEAGNQQALPAGGYVRITFADQGSGMTSQVQRRIFDPYFTTKAGGTGLGLASAYSIMKKHGGHIAVGSVVGSGSVFTCFLPSAGTPPAAPAGAEPDYAYRGRAKGAVLVMDDDSQIRSVADQLLQLLGFQATGCCKGEDAVTLYGEAMRAGTPFLAVLLDLSIPEGMGGKDAARQILSIDPAARLIVSSGYSDDPVLADFAGYGFCAVLPKPYRVSDLAQVLAGITKRT